MSDSYLIHNASVYELQALKIPQNSRDVCAPKLIEAKRCMQNLPGMKLQTQQHQQCEDLIRDFRHCNAHRVTKEFANHLINAYVDTPSYARREGIAPTTEKIVNVKIPIGLKWH